MPGDDHEIELDPNVELIRSVYAHWAQGDFSRGESLAEDIEFVTASPEIRTYHGREGMWKGWHDFLTAWENFRIELTGVSKVGPGVYLVETALQGRGKESGVPIGGAGTNVVAVHDGHIARFEIHWDRAGAASAARDLAEASDYS